MCGICGIINYKESLTEPVLRKMNEAIVHRGPDDEGFFIDGQFGLAMRRLSIIDLETGHQPITSFDKRYVIVYNGELYNYRDLRDQHLKDYSFKTKSDTEVILNLYHKFGKECLPLLNGMFAFAIYDTTTSELFIVRDRLGIKPLYYYQDENYFLFSSEAKSFYKIKNIDLEINFKMIHEFMTFGFIPQPHSIFKKIKKLSPGHFLTIKGNNLSIQPYWDIHPEEIEHIEYSRAIDELTDLMSACVKDQMVSDVPIGAFLSGGIDSSVITWEMNQLVNPVNTFTIGFEEATNQQDVILSRKLSKDLSTNHIETILKTDVISDLNSLISKMDEPFAISSILPLFLNSEIAKEHVKVVLTGDGADELFGGYNRYKFGKYFNISTKLSFLPWKSFSTLGKIFSDISSNEKIAKGHKRIIEPICKFFNEKDLFDKYMSLFAVQSGRGNTCYFDPSITSQFEDLYYSEVFHKIVEQNNNKIDINTLLLFDIKTTLVDEMLTKVDMATMMCSLESRVPFLDNTLVDFVTKLPAEFKVNTDTKKILKDTYKNKLPGEILTARKRGFNLPLDRWIKSRWKVEFIKVFNLHDATRELGINREKLMMDFEIYCNSNHIDGKKYFYLYVLIYWYTQCKKKRT